MTQGALCTDFCEWGFQGVVTPLHLNNPPTNHNNLLPFITKSREVSLLPEGGEDF